MKIGEYEVEHSPYIENLIEPDDGQSKEQALADVLGYHAGAVLKQHELKEKATFTLSRFLSRPNSELGVLVDPESKKIFFGTEAEVQTRLENG